MTKYLLAKCDARGAICVMRIFQCAMAMENLYQPASNAAGITFTSISSYFIPVMRLFFTSNNCVQVNMLVRIYVPVRNDPLAVGNKSEIVLGGPATCYHMWKNQFREGRRRVPSAWRLISSHGIWKHQSGERRRRAQSPANFRTRPQHKELHPSLRRAVSRRLALVY
jgi:hypothetical protein